MLTSFILTSITLANLINQPEIPKQDLDEMVSFLIQCESSNRQWAINKDDGGEDSYSYLQFHKTTFEHFGKRYNLRHDNVFSKEQQTAIAKRMLIEGRENHWKDCFNKYKQYIGL